VKPWSMRAVLICGLGSCVVLLAACSGQAVPERSLPTSPAPRQLRPGTDVTITAVVVEVRSDRAFVLADADLPPAGQLVVMPTAVTVTVTELVTVVGTVALLDGPALQRFGVTVDAAVITVVGTRLMRYGASTAGSSAGSR
jgi:hypothetical protein